MATSRRTGEPYALAGRRMAFTNWYYVYHGEPRWLGRSGKDVSVIGEAGPCDAQFHCPQGPWGLRLITHPAQRLGPILDEQRPWEEGGQVIETIVHEGDRFRAWASTDWGDLKDRGPSYFLYYESSDGLTWQRPDCGLVDYAGNRDNNILGLNGGVVFVDPSAPQSERYKSTRHDTFSQETFEAYKQRRPNDIDYHSFRTDIDGLFGVRGAVSRDGLRWQTIEQPLVMLHSDTPQVVVYYDPLLEKYVGYFRDWIAGPTAEDTTEPHVPGAWLRAGRRAIGRAETDDFRNFPLAEIILGPHLGMAPSQTLYTNCKTTVPGAPDQHLMFPAVWDQASDQMHIQVASSDDGELWHHLPDGCVLETTEFGQWDGGCIFASPNLLELPNGDFALPYTGYDLPHKYPRVRAKRAIGYALWPKGRLIGIDASQRGAFTTVAVMPQGRELLINATTKRAGSIRVAVVDIDGRAIPGREMENAVPLFGDCHRTPVTWKEHNDLGIGPGQGVRLHIELDMASIYSFDFV